MSERGAPEGLIPPEDRLVASREDRHHHWYVWSSVLSSEGYLSVPGVASACATSISDMYWVLFDPRYPREVTIRALRQLHNEKLKAVKEALQLAYGTQTYEKAAELDAAAAEGLRSDCEG